MKLSKNQNLTLLLFLAGLCFINLLQGYFTELIADEAYYWVYSNALDWGYFDHPPMVAIWITISKFFFSDGELSVRFFSAFTLSFTYYIIWLLIDHPKKNQYISLFILILLSTALFSVYGFITVPDSPLMFFVALFLYGYKKYLKDKSLLSYGILAISMACMMYSKYQSVLVIGFVVLSNLKVLSDYKLWLTGFLSLVLFFPHLYWQFENGYPSFMYHLVERKSNSGYKFEYTLIHFVNTIAIVGLTFPIIYKSFFKNLKNKESFNRALNFVIIGFVVFFFLSSFKGHVQAQWIVPISIPLIVIAFNYLVNNHKDIKLFKILAYTTILLMVGLRIILAVDILPLKLEMHGNKEWVLNLDKKVKENHCKPIFVNSYQNTSLYWFYSKNKPYQYNVWWARKNQFDLFDYNKKINVEKGCLIGVKPEESNDTVLSNKKRLYLKKVENVKLNKNLFFDVSQNQKIYNHNKNSISISVRSSQNIENKNVKLFLNLINKENKKAKSLDLKLNTDIIEKGEHTYEASFSKLDIIGENIQKFQIIGTTNKDFQPYRMSTIVNCSVID